MNKTTIRTGSNIAFIKYWGVEDASLNIPLNNSISMTLADAHTTTTVEWDSEGSASGEQSDHIEIDGKVLSPQSAERVVRHLDRIRQLAGREERARVVSQTNFPAAAGIASSASGFSALTVAGCRAFGLELGMDDLSRLSRIGSGSASRSLFAGFVEWEKGHDHESSVAFQIAEPTHWELYDMVAIVSTEEKRISSANGHQIAATSPLLNGRLESLPTALEEVRQAIAQRDLAQLGQVIEQDAVAMHAVMMTSSPSLLYWHGATVELMRSAQQWREEGIPVYFTIDAGPNVHLICEKSSVAPLTAALKEMPFVQDVLVSGPGLGPQEMDDHLF